MNRLFHCVRLNATSSGLQGLRWNSPKETIIAPCTLSFAWGFVPIRKIPSVASVAGRLRLLAIGLAIYGPLAGQSGTVQSSITLTSSLNPSVHGQAITLTAALTPETVSNAAIAQVFPRCAGFCSPTGSMSFYDGNALLGVVTAFTNSFDTFTFVLMTSQMTPGVHSLSASYGGDATYAENTSAPFVQTVLALQIVTASPLPNGFLGSPYSVTLGTNAGSGNDTWMVSGGSLPPPGISLSPGGLVSGTPTLAGSTSFTVTVTDSFGNTASATFSITVMASSPPPPSFLLRTVAGGYASTPGL